MTANHKSVHYRQDFSALTVRHAPCEAGRVKLDTQDGAPCLVREGLLIMQAVGGQYYTQFGAGVLIASPELLTPSCGSQGYVGRVIESSVDKVPGYSAHCLGDVACHLCIHVEVGHGGLATEDELRLGEVAAQPFEALESEVPNFNWDLLIGIFHVHFRHKCIRTSAGD